MCTSNDQLKINIIYLALNWLTNEGELQNVTPKSIYGIGQWMVSQSWRRPLCVQKRCAVIIGLIKLKSITEDDSVGLRNSQQGVGTN